MKQLLMSCFDEEELCRNQEDECDCGNEHLTEDHIIAQHDQAIRYLMRERGQL